MLDFRIICAGLAFLGAAALGSPSYSTLKREASDVNDIPKVNQNTLRQVILLMRHGERAPVDTYPNDPNINATMAPFGWGQLTKQGRTNIYNQGSFLRDRYDEFLGKTYTPDKFWLQSTSADRTKMTAMILSAALWKPDEDQKFNPEVPWQPVSLHYWTRPEDKLLIIWNACPRYTMERMMLENSTEVRELNEQNKELYKELSEKTGSKITGPGGVGDLYATLRSETAIGVPKPDWTKDYYPDKLLDLSIYHLAMNSKTDILKKLSGGPFIKKAIKTMQQKKKGTLKPPSRKMFAYVSHDSTLVNVMTAMGVWDGKDTDYNCMFMMELHENDGEWNVQLFQRTSTEPGTEPTPLTIPGCNHACPLDKFIDLLKPVTPENYKSECRVSDPNYVVPAAPPA